MVCQENKERIIPIGNVSKEALNLYLEEGRKVFVKDDSEHALFTNCSGKAMSRQGFWKMLKGYAQEAGIHRDITPHTDVYKRQDFTRNLRARRRKRQERKPRNMW